MTISTTTSRITYAGDGSTTAFAVPFVFFGADELEVIELTLATGVETVKALTTHYTVTGGNGAAGTVNAVVSPPGTVSWTIARKTKQTQLVDYTPNDPFPAETHERAIDRLTALVQELSDKLARAITLSVTTAITTLKALPDPVAGRFLRGNATNDGWENADIAGAGAIGIPVIVAEGGTGATTAAQARTNLGLGTAAVLDAGTAANELVQLDGTGKLPAVDGSQLTGLQGGDPLFRWASFI